ncbi:MAG: L-threonylcarbamoyladenylate synthase [Patescibacteria group bacterium]
MTEILEVTGDGFERAVARAGLVLRRGGLVAFPTETVYGLGANGLDADAVQRIFIAKGRPADNPLILHVESPAAAAAYVEDMPPAAERLAALFWPGPLTLVLPRSPRVPEIVSAGLPSLAVRVPAHPMALALIRAAGVPVAAPSANSSSRPSPTTAAHVLADLGGRIDLILDGGPTEVGLESTVLDLTGPSPRLLRPGGITVEALAAALGEDGLELGGGDGERPASPGMKYRHYAPRSPLTLVDGEPAAIRALIASEMALAGRQGRTLAALVYSESVPALHGLGLVLDLGPRDDPATACRRLFTLLRECDGAGVDGILAEAGDAKGLGLAVHNRLLKAAGGHVVRAGGGA